MCSHVKVAMSNSLTWSRFKPLNEGIMTTRITHICEKEGVELSPEAMSTLSQVSYVTALSGTISDPAPDMISSCRRYLGVI